MSSTAGLSGTIDQLDWTAIPARLDADGHAVLPGLLDATTLSALVALARAGQGTLIPLGHPWPAPLADMMGALYRHLVPTARRWSDNLGTGDHFADEWTAFTEQPAAPARFDRLRADEHLALQQCPAGERGFPLQVVALLSTPGEDFDGGEFVLTEQRPRMQSRPMVVPLGRGDVAVIATAERPVHGRQGPYRVNLRHGISRVRRGERLGLELSFR